MQTITAEMEQLKKNFPESMKYDLSLDTTTAITAGIREIIITLFIALALVILVVFIFIQDWRATIIPTLAIPVSLVGAFMFFPLLGFTINTLSLLGLVLAIGIVVDDAIVVVEAVQVNIEKGIRAGYSHYSGPDCCLRSCSRDGRNNRYIISAVCHNHCGFGHGIFGQCLILKPCPLFHFT